MSNPIPIFFPSPRFKKDDVDKWLKENLPPGWKAVYSAPTNASSPGPYLKPKAAAASPTPDTKYDIWPVPEATDDEIAGFEAAAKRMMRKLPSES
jgi:hypothetical protein